MQQINLYQEEFRQQSLPLSALQALLATAGLLLLLLGASAWRYWQAYGLDAQVQQAQQQLQQSQQLLAEGKIAFPAAQAEPRLARRLVRLKQDVLLKQRVLQVLSGRQFGNTQGFVEQVSGLARQRIEGMWLTQLDIRQGGAQLGMKGNALQPELLPRYLQRLAHEPVFAGVEFDTFLMQRRQQAPHWIEFSLATKAKAVESGK